MGLFTCLTRGLLGGLACDVRVNRMEDEMIPIRTVQEPPEDVRDSYRELKSIDGKVVGWTCAECGMK